MATPRAWLGASPRLILSFVLILLVPAAAVVWLGVKLIEQDRALASRQLRERRESSADRLIAGLEQAVSSTERRLDGEPTSLPIQPDDDAVLVTLGPSGIEAYPRDRLLYLPAIPPGPAELTAAFEAGEALEFRAKDYRGAAAAFRALAISPSAAVRAGALLRLARTLRKTGRADEALRVYADLAHIPDARLSGLPADLVARRARYALLQELGRGTELGGEARSLQTDLVAARWPLDHGTFLAYSEQISRWVGAEQPAAPDRDALSAASEWIWRQWTGADRAEFHAAGRRALRFAGVGVTVLWQSRGDRLMVLVAGPRFQQREWFDAPRSALDARGLRVALADADGQAVLGTLPTDGSATERRPSAVTHLPWTVFVGSADMAADLDELANRRRLLFAGLALLVGLVIAGGYFIGRAVSREFAVVQLQSDFVSAVSHEFRTPLTSLRQFTDLLNDDPDLPAFKRQAEKILGLELGADDYVTKPFSANELRARIKAVRRRFEEDSAGVYCFGDCEVDFDRAEIRRGGQPVEVTALEFRLLRTLIRCRGRVLTREQLIQQAWGPDTYIGDRVVDTHILNLRKKIEPAPARPQFLHSVRGIGYRFDG